MIGFIAGVAAGWGISHIQVGKAHEGPAPVQVAEAPDSAKNAVTPRDTAATHDTVAAAPAPAAIVVTDTIQANRFLTTMARRHYGNYEFWVYIYEENADKLGHPDKLTPGTVVTIPPKEKYGIDADNPQSVKLARHKSVEIYARYEK